MSDSNNSSSSSGGMSAISLLGVVFVTLKLLGITAVASWSWWWVTAPFWLGGAVILSIVVFGATIIGLLKIFSK